MFVGSNWEERGNSALLSCVGTWYDGQMKRMLSLYFISEIFLSLGIGVVQYAQPFYYASSHIGDQKIGYLFAVNAIFGGASALVAGIVADRFGATRMFKLGTLLIGVGSLATSVTHVVSLWFVTAAISGIGGSILSSTENVVLSSLLVGFERSHLISRFTAFYMVIIGIGIAIAGFMVPHWGLQWTMIIGALLALVAPGIRLFVQAPDTFRKGVLRWPGKPLVIMALYAILFGIAGGLFNPFATLILNMRYHASPSITSAVYAVSIFMIALGAYLVRPLIQRLRQQATLAMAFALSVVSQLLFIASVATTMFVGVYFLLTIATAIPQPIIDAAFLDLVHASEFSQMFGMRVFGTRVGNAIGSSIGGGLLKGNHFDLLMICSAAFFVVAYVYLMVVQRPLRRLAGERAKDEQ